MEALQSIFTVAILSGLYDFFQNTSGPDFLAFYIQWLILLFVSQVAVRKLISDTPGVSLGFLALFEGSGLARIIIGSSNGLHRCGYLIALMVLGGVVMSIRIRHFAALNKGMMNKDGRSTGCGSSGCSSSSCSGGSGCGGSSCGGGGCGGCGGS